MFELNEEFLNAAGLSEMPATEKAEFLKYSQEQLERRIGEKMSEGMTDAQLDEFEKIAEGDPGAVAVFLRDGYKQDDIYQALLRNSPSEEGSPEFLSEYATAKWLDENCPQYAEIIQNAIMGLQAEISEKKESLLHAV